MTTQEAEALLRKGPEGVKEWNKYRENNGEIPSLAGINLGDVDLSNINLTEACLSSAKLNGAKLHKARLIYADLDHADLSSAQLHEANVSGASLVSANLNHAELTRCNLFKSQMSDAHLCSADLRMAILNQADLRGASFRQANISFAFLRNVSVDLGTDFTDASVTDCHIDRVTLEMLSNKEGLYGGLPRSALMHMAIYDDVALIRSMFSGFLQWIHLFALAVFLFPYAYFILRHWADARFQLVEPGQTVALWKALLCYIVTGGRHWHSCWTPALVPLVCFCYGLAYNLARAVLLCKTKKLELEKEISGLHPRFSLDGFWKRMFGFTFVGFWINVLLVVVHSIYFLMQEIPVR